MIKNTSSRNYPFHQGFTLIEMILVILLIGIISGISALVINSSVNMSAFMQTRKDLVSTGAMTAALFQRDVSRIRDDHSLLFANVDSVRFKIATGETIAWAVRNEKLYRQRGSGTPHLIQEKVDEASFHYYDNKNKAQTGFPLSQDKRRKVKLIELWFRLAQGEQEVAYVAAATPENLRLTDAEHGGEENHDEDDDHHGGDGHNGGDDDHHGDDGDHGGHGEHGEHDD